MFYLVGLICNGDRRSTRTKPTPGSLDNLAALVQKPYEFRRETARIGEQTNTERLCMAFLPNLSPP
jgi:hypothetical protein